jgi:hypothetical protein
MQALRPQEKQTLLIMCGLEVRVPGQRSRDRFPALPHYFSRSGSGTGSTQPRENELLGR